MFLLLNNITKIVKVSWRLQFNNVLTSPTVTRLIEKFRESGSVEKCQYRSSVGENPGIQRPGPELQISKSLLWRILLT